MKKLLIGILVLAVVAAVAYVVLNQMGLLPTAAQATPTEVPMLPPVEAASEVVADAIVVPAFRAQLSLPVGGIVAEVLVSEGDQVESGDLLLRLDSARQAAGVAQAEAGLLRAQRAVAELKAGPRPEEIQAAEASVQAALAQLARVELGALPEEVEAAEATLDGARASLRKVREGAREEELVAARAELANAEATLRQAQYAYDQVKWVPSVETLPESLQLQQATNAHEAAKSRLRALEKGATPADVAVAQAQIDQAQAQLDALQAPARTADVAAAEAEIKRAQAQLDLVKAGVRPETIAAAEAEVAAAQAALDQARVALAETELRAPAAGIIASLDVEVGEQVGPGSPVVLLADLSTWQVETDDLTELNVVQVREGSRALVTFDAIPDLELHGTVIRIRPIGESKMGDMTYTVVIEPERQDDRLRWNMTASVVIETD